MGPFWVIQSPANTAAINALWATLHSRFADAPTYFDAAPGRTAEDSAEAFIGTVDEHHPYWRTFEIIGTPLSARLLAALRECAPGSAQETGEGFVFTKDDSN
jgi:hypothetical protein